MDYVLFVQKANESIRNSIITMNEKTSKYGLSLSQEDVLIKSADRLNEKTIEIFSNIATNGQDVLKVANCHHRDWSPLRSGRLSTKVHRTLFAPVVTSGVYR